jgi:hypothetical protein
VADHPVKVPPELVKEWINDGPPLYQPTHFAHFIADRAAQWGADQELEACIDVLGSQSAWDVLAECTGWKEFRDESEDILRAARRPKPPSLAEQGMEALQLGKFPGTEPIKALRAALNRLAELEAQQ